MAIRLGSTFLLLGLLATGCGGGGGGGSDSAPSSGAILVALTIEPGSILTIEGGSVAVSAVGLMSDGSEIAAPAAWSLSGGDVGSLSASSGPTVTFDADALGDALLTASYQGFIAQAAIEVTDWLPATAPTAAYGMNTNGSLLSYDAAGNATVRYEGFATAYGLALDPDATTAYVIGILDGTSDRVIATLEADAAPGSAPTNVVLLPPTPAGSNWFPGLDMDSEGKILLQNCNTGDLTKYDPATGTFLPYGDMPAASQISVALTPADEVLSSPILTNPSSLWVWKQDPVGKTKSMWAMTPSDIATQFGSVTWTSIAVDGAGEVFLVNYEGSDIYRAVDLNGDGDALEDGELTLFATLPFVFEAGKSGISAMSNAGGHRGLLVNAMRVDGTTTGGAGLYWVADLNGDGDAGDEDEVVLFSGTSVKNDQDTGCVAAGR